MPINKLPDRTFGFQNGFNDQSWVSTENQTVFNLSNGKYETGKNRIEVYIGGVKQVSELNFFETNQTSFTLSEGVPAGTLVEAKWYETIVPTIGGHAQQHRIGGVDEINIKDLAGYDYFKFQVDSNRQVLEDKINNIGNATPKGAYATVAALQAAFPTGTNGVYVVSADSKWYYWDGTSWVAGGLYQAASLTDLWYNTLTDLQTVFSQFTGVTSVRIQTNLTSGKYINGSGVAATGLSSDFYTDFMPITPGMYYSYQGAVTGSGVSFFSFYSSASEAGFISSVKGQDGITLYSQTAKAPTNATHMRCSYSNLTNKPFSVIQIMSSSLADLLSSISTLSNTASTLGGLINTETTNRISADNLHAAASTAHTATQISYDASNSVKQKIDAMQTQVTNITSGAAPNAAEIVDARLGADSVARASLGAFMRELHAQQVDSAVQSVTLKHGINIV